MFPCYRWIQGGTANKEVSTILISNVIEVYRRSNECSNRKCVPHAKWCITKSSILFVQKAGAAVDWLRTNRIFSRFIGSNNNRLLISICWFTHGSHLVLEEDEIYIDFRSYSSRLLLKMILVINSIWLLWFINFNKFIYLLL